MSFTIRDLFERIFSICSGSAPCFTRSFANSAVVIGLIVGGAGLDASYSQDQQQLRLIPEHGQSLEETFLKLPAGILSDDAASYITIQESVPSATGMYGNDAEEVTRDGRRLPAVGKGEKVIHVTDYLYNQPEIREAHQAYLEMKRERPEELQIMQKQVASEIGDRRTFNVVDFEESREGPTEYLQIEFELKAIGERSEIWVETDEWDPDKINDEVVSEMMAALEERTPPRSVNPDQGVILNNIDIFAEGDPGKVPDPQGEGIVKVLVTDIRDGWDPDGDGGFVAGFFNPGDLAPRTSNSMSNEAAIIYIDSRPGIYSEIRPTDPLRPLSVVAHEFQHLIEAGRGNLITFMNEGQSELAEVLNGYNARVMAFLDEPDEVSGDVETNAEPGFLRWRRGEPETVLFDYQRAQLFHGYLYERLGVGPVGKLTQSSSGTPWVQYQRILNEAEEGLEFRDVLGDFYIANLINDNDVGGGIYGYSPPQFSNVMLSNPARRFGVEERPWVTDEQVALRYGSAKYTRWESVEDITIIMDSPSEVTHYVVAKDWDGMTTIETFEDDEVHLNGGYRTVTMVSVNVVPHQVAQGGSNYGARNFYYTADWTPSDLRVVSLSYAQSPEDFEGPVPVLGLPFVSGGGTEFRAISVLVNTELGGTLQGADFRLWPFDGAVEGSGTLRVSFTESEQAAGIGIDAVHVPTESLAEVDLDFEEISQGMNQVDFSGFNIEMEPDKNYHVVYQVLDESEDAELLFMFDQGSSDVNDSDYYPVRSLIGGIQDDGSSGWSYLLGDEDDDSDNDHKNMVMTTRVLSRVPVENGFPERPLSGNVELLQNYPNPFNTGTTLRFNIPDELEEDETVPVRVDVFDITGRRITTVAEGDYVAGSHPVTFEAGNLASGVYVVRLQAGGSVDSRKIMLLK